MLIIRTSKSDSFVRYISSKYKRNARQGLVLGDLAYSNTATYLIVPDEALSVAFLYSIYLKAKEYNLRPEVMYAVSIDPDKVFPGDVKRVGDAWAYRRLRRSEIKLLKNKWITPSLLEVLVK